MDIHGFKRLNDDEATEFWWQHQVARFKDKDLRATRHVIIGGYLDEATGEYTYKAVEVRDHATNELLGRYSPDEFKDVNYDDEGWFDADAPYDPCY